MLPCGDLRSVQHVVLLLTAWTCVMFTAPCVVSSQAALNFTEAPVTCSPWLLRYVAWHKEHRNLSDSRYLIYNCHKTIHSCSGTGDRIRAILFMLRVAAANDMVLLVNWDLRSVNLLDFLLPAEIDWSMTDPRLSALITTDVPPEAEGVFKQVFDPGPPENAAPAAELLVKFAQMKVVRVICFQHLEKPFHGQLEGISSSSGGNMTDFYMKFACMFKSMFRPSPALQASVESHTRKVYKQYPAAYMAWHLRAGGQVGEEKPILMQNHQPLLIRVFTMSHLIPQHSRLSQILYGLVCAQELGATLSLSTRTTPIMFSTDLNPLRDLVIAGVIPMLAAPDFKAHHFDHDVKATHEDNHNVFVDLLMMSRARCLLTHVSGFSHIAVAWGGALSGRLCWTDLVSCIRAKPHVFGGVVI